MPQAIFKLFVVALGLFASTVISQTTSYDLFLGDPKTKLYFSYKCTEGKRLVQRLEFGTPEAAEKAGYTAGECTLPTRSKAEELSDSVMNAREGASSESYYAGDSPYDTYTALPSPYSANGKTTGKVVGITDGDTVTVLVNGQEIKVRLAGIDAPEKGQAFGQAAKARLSDLIFGKQVELLAEKQDGYGRTVGKIVLNGKDINLQMVEEGMAWHYKKYAKEQSPEDQITYATAHTYASSRRSGLWIDGTPVSPGDFRSSFASDGVSDFAGGSSTGPGASRSPGGPVPVRTYTRRDGTVVRSHTRSAPRKRP